MTCKPLVLIVLGALSFSSLGSEAVRQNVFAPPEEITITGERALRERMLAAEVRTYTLFNQFNDERRFNIRCGNTAVTGSHLQEQSCAPEFELQARRAQAQDFKTSLLNFINPDGALPDGSVGPQHVPAEAVIAGQQRAYRQKMRQIAEEHPEFLQSLIDYSELRQQYQKAAAPVSPATE